MMAKKESSIDHLELVREFGLSLAGLLRGAFDAYGAFAPFVLVGKHEGQWRCGMRGEVPVFDDPRLNEWIGVAAGGSCGAPLVIVIDPPSVTVGCLRCYFGVDVIDLFDRAACT